MMKLFYNNAHKYRSPCGSAIFLFFVILVVSISVAPVLVHAQTTSTSFVPSGSFPRLANYFLHWTMTPAQAKQLSKWDIVVLDMEMQHTEPNLIRQMHIWNPNIKILVYITPEEIIKNANSSYSVMRQQFVSGLSPTWYLVNSQGKQLSWWNGTWLLDVGNNAPMVNGERYNQYLVNFVSHTLLGSGLWDGVFYDNSWDNITYFAGKDIDMNRDGIKDTNPDQAWRNGMKYIYDQTRTETGGKYIILGNGMITTYINNLDGVLIENFQKQPWSQVMNVYQTYESRSLNKNPIVLINSNGDNYNAKKQYQRMRYGLTSVLLNNGYYSYDFGDTDHGQTWQYDEYSVDLGNANSVASSEHKYTTYKPDVWERTFDHGISLVNSTNQSTTVSLGATYEKIHGVQDPAVNNGAIVSNITLRPKDGLILLKTLSTLNDVLFPNGSFARFLRPDGSHVRNGFFVFDSTKSGGDEIEHIDLNGNGRRDLIVVSGNQLNVWRDDGELYMRVYPYGANYHGSIRVAVGDLNGDGKKEVYVAPASGYPAPIKVYTYFGEQEGAGWYPFGKKYAGGFSLAAGNVTGGMGQELVIGAGTGVAPTVSVFNNQFQQLYKWNAFEPSFRGGISVATGDVNGNGKDEIIVGAGPGKKPLIRIFNAKGNLLYPQIQAYNSFNTPGIQVGAADVDFDGKADIIGYSTGVF